MIRKIGHAFKTQILYIIFRAISSPTYQHNYLIKTVVTLVNIIAQSSCNYTYNSYYTRIDNVTEEKLNAYLRVYVLGVSSTVYHQYEHHISTENADSEKKNE